MATCIKAEICQCLRARTGRQKRFGASTDEPGLKSIDACWQSSLEEGTDVLFQGKEGAMMQDSLDDNDQSTIWDPVIHRPAARYYWPLSSVLSKTASNIGADTLNNVAHSTLQTGWVALEL